MAMPAGLKTEEQIAYLSAKLDATIFILQGLIPGFAIDILDLPSQEIEKGSHSAEVKKIMTDDLKDKKSKHDAEKKGR